MTNPREHRFPSRVRLSGRWGKIRSAARPRWSVAFVAAVAMLLTEAFLLAGGLAWSSGRGGEKVPAPCGCGPRRRAAFGLRYSDSPETNRERSRRPRGLRAPVRRILLSERYKLWRRRGLRGPMSGCAHCALHRAGRLGQDRRRCFDARRALLCSARGQSLSNHARRHLPLSALAHSRLFRRIAERPDAAKRRCGDDAQAASFEQAPDRLKGATT